MSNDDFHDEAVLEQAINGDVLFVDEDGETWQLDTYDDYGGFVTRDRSESHRVSHGQLAVWEVEECC